MPTRLNEALTDIKDTKESLNNIEKELFRQHHDLYGNGKKEL